MVLSAKLIIISVIRYANSEKFSKSLIPVRFVILSTLETAPETGLPIYDEIQTRIKPQVRIGN